MNRERLETMGWRVEHTGGGVFNAHKDFAARTGEIIGVTVGADCAAAHRSGGRFLRAAELGPQAEPDEEVLLLTPGGPTPEGLEILGEEALREAAEALELVEGI
ncbi:hypothetical protein [Desulfovirgula thermocuniculi]|uniref:hypothetical protein n=1 Tax=Desulfovirgula thermocuniculi TaxID=348842 RepID=UPI00042157C2|nr:hypothetical protein [Desulfovirgula thermocuniculi]